jgi:hypothetical protein
MASKKSAEALDGLFDILFHATEGLEYGEFDTRAGRDLWHGQFMAGLECVKALNQELGRMAPNRRSRRRSR